MLKRLALACGALLLACGLWQASDASRFEPVTSAQLAAGLSTCAGAGAVGYTVQITAANTFGCTSSTPGTGALRYDTGQSLTAAQQAQGRSNVGINSTGALAYRNRLINGSFAINQRGSASASTTYSAGAYTLDRWKAGSGGVTLSFSAAANGDVTVTITAGTLVQVIEGSAYLPEGGAYVLSWTGTATARVYQGTASGSYAASPVAATGLTAGTNTTVEFGTGTLGLVQFEPGTTATAFERRDDELRRAQRYYETSIGYIYTNAYAAGANMSVQNRMITKRTSPSVSISGITASNMNPPSVQVLNTQEILFYATATTGTGLCYYEFYYYASAEL